MTMAFQNPKPVLYDQVVENTPLIIENEESSQVSTYQEYDNVYFAFIDVLGFSKTFEDNRENPSSEFAQKFRKTFQYYAKLMDQFESMSPQNLLSTGQTSDSLYFYTDRPDFLLDFIKVFNHFSLYAMSQNVFFRGGISKGKLFIELPHHYYGDCVIKSYLLESKIAKLPRVMIDQATYEDLCKIESMDDLIEPDKDKTRFHIKPFVYRPAQVMCSDFPYLKNVLLDFSAEDWTRIGTYIDKGLEQFEFDERNYPKYCFLKKEYGNTKNYPSIFA